MSLCLKILKPIQITITKFPWNNYDIPEGYVNNQLLPSTNRNLSKIYWTNPRQISNQTSDHTYKDQLFNQNYILIMWTYNIM